jgi:hypothetical protein
MIDVQCLRTIIDEFLGGLAAPRLGGRLYSSAGGFLEQYKEITVITVLT